MKKILASMMFAAFAVTFCLADVPRPEKPTPEKPKNEKKSSAIDTYLQIDLDREAKEAKLIIPRSQLKELRAELDAIDGGVDTASSAGITRLQTIVGGVFLSLAFVFAGFWFIKPGHISPAGGRAAALIAVIFAGGAFASIAFGNAGPPAEARSITGKMFSSAVHMYGFGSGKVKLEVSDDEKYPKLIVPDPKEEKKPE